MPPSMRFARSALVCAIALFGSVGFDTAARAVSEIEPNDSIADADLSSLLITGSIEITGSISVTADRDKFRIELAQALVVRFETFYSNTQDCAEAGITTRLNVLDSSGNESWTDATSGIQLCSAIVVLLPAGISYIEVLEDGQNATVSNYLLQVTIQGDAGNEDEPNETAATATSELFGVSDGYVLGGHQVLGDSDFYSIQVENSESIRAELIEGSEAENCESNGIDSRITLYAPDGATQLADNDDDGRGFCSLIDGSGSSPLTGGAHDLPAGTYYLQVRASQFVSGLDGQFDYRLDIRTVKHLLFADGFESNSYIHWSGFFP